MIYLTQTRYVADGTTYGSITGYPCDAPITAPFGEARPDAPPGVQKVHPGTDLGIPDGTPLRAPADGVMIYSAFDAVMGWYAIVKHDEDVSSEYLHLREQSPLANGTAVKMGDTIGYSGNTGTSTGPHCHWNWRVKGALVNALDYIQNAPPTPAQQLTALADTIADIRVLVESGAPRFPIQERVAVARAQFEEIMKDL